MDRILLLLGVVLVLATGGVALLSDKAGGSNQSGAASPDGGAAVKSDKVDIKEFKFMPVAIEVKAGAKVTFTNADTADHTATSKPAGAFDTDRIKKGESKSVTLSKPGEYEYVCAYHAFMKAKIRVVE